MIVIKTKNYSVKGIDIEARIIQNPEGKFSWELSHVSKPKSGGHFHHAVGIWDESLLMVEDHLNGHVESFNNAFEIKKNLDY